MPITLRILCLLLLLLSLLNAAGQEEDLRNAIENITENLVEEQDLSELIEKLAYFRKHPINLNESTPEQLKSLFFLSTLQINSFFSYRKSTKLIDVLELQAIPGFDPETINKLLPYVTIDGINSYEHLKLKNMLHTASHELTTRYSRLLQEQKGFKDLLGSRYLGTPEKFLLKYRYNFQETICAGLLLEKDAGELMFNKDSGIAHLSAHIAWYKLGRIKKIIIGDYSLKFGQGLTLWSGFSFGKGADVTSVAAKDVGLKPSSSSNESLFFRGAASTINLMQYLDLTPFFSFRKVDASLKNLSDGSIVLSNPNSSGLHRTQSELKNKKSVKQQVYGAALQYNTDVLNVGIIAYQTNHEHPFIAGPQLYNKYDFNGRQLQNIGMHFNYSFREVYFYGEIAHSVNGAQARTIGAMTSFSRKISAVVLNRSYDKDYHNFYSNGLGEATETNNEKGWYTGLNYLLTKDISWSIYCDLFKFPWLKYRVDFASSGFEMLSQLTYTKNKVFKVVARFKLEQKQQNPNESTNNKHLVYVTKQTFRLDWSIKINRKFNLNQRTELALYQKGIHTKETGILQYQDLSYSPMSSKLSGNLRLAWFKTGSFNSRIYAYEDDVLQASGSGLYSGKGFRAFVNARFKATTKLDIWLRLASFIYPGETIIGAGLDEIAGNKKTELKVQLSYQF